MVKLIIFDLDGVLVEAKKIHYETLNKALSKIDNKYTINWEEHLSKYDGLKTNQKLELLSIEKKLPVEKYKEVWDEKQKLTIEALKGLIPNLELINCISKLSSDGYKIACCSNSIRKTILIVLSKLNIIEYFDLILSNEDVKNSKPHPEIYWKAISQMGCLSEETLIVEDSPYGLLAAHRSKSNILRVLNPQEVNYENIKNKLNEIKN